ncbi:MAG: Flp pilus assembly complex ATPase component TadA, partial [Candidatus Omnitrophica bacterium]|nr:Flp pilus assembly complex ATPase component TadA [Candidatus Omnitrophota bacterium]
MKKKQRLRLGESLIKEGLITQRHLEKGLNEQKKTGEYLGRTLVKLGLLSEKNLVAIFSKEWGIPSISLKNVSIDTEILSKVPAKFASHYNLIPISLEGDVLSVAVSDPFNLQAVDDLKLLLGNEINVFVAGEDDINEAITRYYGIGAETLEKIIDESGGMEKIKPEIVTDNIEDMSEDASIIKFVNQLLLEAYHDKATDIHIEPYERDLRIRYRVDGILYETNIPPTIKHFQSAIISRIKILAGLNIAERRLPQDGRIKVRVGENELDLRVSILPTAYGESVNIRLLSTSMVLMGLEHLGLSEVNFKILQRMIEKPHGIILVTGPTGSGKTTSLYACLSRINNAKRKIITIEDPIEYMIRGISQIQVYPKIDLTFARGLRTMLRHDPDVMMVGEIRDFETAEITIRVSLTGHLVFSTLHTNDAAGAVTRLLDMGIEPYLIASSVECIIAQRLVRVICQECKEEVEVTPQVITDFLGVKPKGKTIIYEGKGCEKCKFRGYRGRTAIYEFLVMNDTIRDMVLKKEPANNIKKQAIAKGMKTLRQDGWEKIQKCITTIEEV